MLRAIGLIPSTVQNKVNNLESLLEGLFVYFWAAFIVEASLPIRSFIACVLGVFLLVPHATWIVSPEAKIIQVLG
jgi:hypothetical protein